MDLTRACASDYVHECVCASVCVHGRLRARVCAHARVCRAYELVCMGIKNMCLCAHMVYICACV